MILLCGRHHTLVHEGGLGRGPAPTGRARTWDFLMPDGRRIDADGYTAWRDVDSLTMILAANACHNAAADPRGIFPPHGGADFSLHECVRTLWGITLQEPIAEAAWLCTDRALHRKSRPNE